MRPIREAKTEMPVDFADSVRDFRFVRVVMWAATIVAGLLQALAARFYISGDGNSYLDVASAYLRGDFANAINAYWSPFYSWLIALILWAFKPSEYWETTILHLLSFAGLLVALLAFEFFLRNFLAAKQNFVRPEEGESVYMPLSVWWMLGYGLFLSATLEVLSMYPTSPDVWVCAATFLSAGLILKISIKGGLPYFGALGLVLGLGYLIKTFYFPLA